MKIDIDKVIKELSALPDYDRQLMLQKVEGESNEYGLGRFDNMKHSETDFDTPIYDIPYTNSILKDLGMCRARLMKMNPYQCYSYHVDLSKRVHIPLITHDHCFMVIDDEVHRYPADGSHYLVDTTKRHTAINASNDVVRIHIVGCVTY